MKVLTVETGKNFENKLAHLKPLENGNSFGKPLTEEDILNKPFYTVESSSNDQAQMSSSDLNYRYSVVHTDASILEFYKSIVDYRNLLSDMLLSIRVKSPSELTNLTIADVLASFDWSNPDVGAKVEEKLVRGNHNSLCLAHGRKPILPVKIHNRYLRRPH